MTIPPLYNGYLVCGCNQISPKHISFWYLLLEPHQTTYHSNRDVWLKQAIELGMSTSNTLFNSWVWYHVMFPYIVHMYENRIKNVTFIWTTRVHSKLINFVIPFHLIHHTTTFISCCLSVYLLDCIMHYCILWMYTLPPKKKRKEKRKKPLPHIYHVCLCLKLYQASYTHVGLYVVLRVHPLGRYYIFICIQGRRSTYWKPKCSIIEVFNYIEKCTKIMG